MKNVIYTVKYNIKKMWFNSLKRHLESAGNL